MKFKIRCAVEIHMQDRVLVALKHLARKLGPVKPVLEWVAELECAVATAWTNSAHKRLLAVQWAIPPEPENFDHHIDQYYLWSTTANHQWTERGVFGALALKGGDVLELCCGDGFNSRNFYSARSKRIVACDFDAHILKTARRKNSAPNVSFQLADIRTQMPEGVFENVVWDAAIEHFTEEEIAGILGNIVKRLTPDGVLSGYTVVEREDGVKHLGHHEYEFKDKSDLLRLLKPFFKNIVVFETIYKTRHNLFFWASQSVIPFGHDWKSAIWQKAEMN